MSKYEYFFTIKIEQNESRNWNVYRLLCSGIWIKLTPIDFGVEGAAHSWVDRWAREKTGKKNCWIREKYKVYDVRCANNSE